MYTSVLKTASEIKTEKKAYMWHMYYSPKIYSYQDQQFIADALTNG